MAGEPLGSLARLESDLWEAADQLRSNSKLTSTQYFMPVLGIIFLRHAANRFEEATRQIEDDRASGKMPKRPAVKADYVKRRALWLPEEARYDHLISLPKGTDLGEALNAAMNAIEDAFEPLKGQLPKEYTIFEGTLLEDILKIFNREALKQAGGDVFGRIYEYFLMKFAVQGAWDNGEFFTPPSIVQTIVNVIEPEHGTVLDPACGSGGMFVQSSHFIEQLGQDTAHRVTFYGQEKNPSTIRIAKMNLAVHGLEGDIRDANTFYEDVHTLAGKCDFVMANPPFNVDMVDAERVESDVRLPFGLPGVNKSKRVSNANYLWISYFNSYLNENGRAGFVMSSQASSAGHGEKEVRRKIVQTGDVDVMISIRQNFFYTRSVPCELWFFDKGKSKERRGKVLMIDARNVFRKVTRNINDFSPEQLANLSSIVWLYRGQTKKFLSLVQDYFGKVCEEAQAIPDRLEAFKAAWSELQEPLGPRAGAPEADEDAAGELREAQKLYESDRSKLLKELEAFGKKYGSRLPATNDRQHAAKEAFDPIADRVRGLIKQVDLLYKLTSRVCDAANGTQANRGTAASAAMAGGTPVPQRELRRLLRQLDAARKEAAQQLRQASTYHRQIVWLQDRFPDAELADVPGLVKLVDVTEIEANDWSLTPGRYVGVAPPEEDEDFDFEEALREIHVELADLDREAAELARKIRRNFEELGI